MPSIFIPKGEASSADPEISKNFQMEKIGPENWAIGHEAMDGEDWVPHRQMIQELLTYWLLMGLVMFSFGPVLKSCRLRAVAMFFSKR